AVQEFWRERAIGGSVDQYADGNGDADGSEQPCEEDRDSEGGCCHGNVLSLRRHNPDQVQRVPAVRTGGSLSSLTGAPLGTAVNLCRPLRLSKRAGRGLVERCAPLKRQRMGQKTGGK